MAGCGIGCFSLLHPHPGNSWLTDLWHDLEKTGFAHPQRTTTAGAGAHTDEVAEGTTLLSHLHETLPRCSLINQNAQSAMLAGQLTL
jgi:hypothetical protein